MRIVRDSVLGTGMTFVSSATGGALGGPPLPAGLEAGGLHRLRLRGGDGGDDDG